jgi:ligand-binding sensor domain-containing protein
MVQDDQGFMWFGTQYGLNRFDGYSFKVFRPDPDNSNSLSGVFSSALFKDRDGVLWVGCEQFLNRFERTAETFTRYPIPFVINISQDSAGVLWLATSTGLYGLNTATRKIRHYLHDSNDPSSLSSNDVQFSGEDREGRFWVANSEGLDQFDRAIGKVTLHIPLHKSSSAFYEDRDGALWLAKHGAGLLKFDREHRRFIRYRNDPFDPESLPQNNVESLFADREGSIWAGLGRLGLARFGRRPPRFRNSPILTPRLARFNPLWVEYTRIVRESCGSVRRQHSTVSTVSPANTLPIATPPDQRLLPM